MKVKLLEGYYSSTETGGQHWEAGSVHDVGDGLAEYLFVHHKAEPADSASKTLKSKVDADAKKAAAEAAVEQPGAEARAKLVADERAAAEARRVAHAAAVAQLSAELQAKDDARHRAERKAKYDAEAEAILAKTEAEAKAEVQAEHAPTPFAPESAADRKARLEAEAAEADESAKAAKKKA